MDTTLIHDEKREEDLQKICEAIIYSPIRDTGDYGMGGECPFCYSGCSWNDSISEISHEPDCIYLIAKDLMTK